MYCLRACLIIAFVLSSLPGLNAQVTPSTCVEKWSENKEQLIIKYVRQKYRIPESVSLSIVDDKMMADSCFRALTFQGKGLLKTWELKLYLSPDGRYLTDNLLDTSISPIDEDRRKMEGLMAGFSENRGTNLGSESAPVTIALFSDFQCPYCRQLAEIMAEVLPSEDKIVRVVFHHLPLSMHAWARTAAQGAACAQLQDSRSFWAMHDQLFKMQHEISPDNVKQELNDIAAAIPTLDFKVFQNCLKNDMSLGLVLRDLKLASSNEVTGTPTLFINGHRVQGIKSAAQLRELIGEAKNESLPSP